MKISFWNKICKMAAIDLVVENMKKTIQERMEEEDKVQEKIDENGDKWQKSTLAVVNILKTG